MITQGSKQRGGSRRAGAWALSLLGTPPNPQLLRAVGDGDGSPSRLRSCAAAPGTTLRTRLAALARAELLSRRPGSAGRGVEYRLTPAGEALLPVAGVLGAWLEEAPGAARPLGGAEAKAAVGALSEGWSAMLLRPLAARSLSLAELDELIARLNYPALERRIAAMRDAGQVEALPARGRETPYAVTPWLRRAAAPLLAAIAWEREHLADAPRTGRIDFEALLLLAVPLLRIDPAATGSCRIAVELPAGGNSEPAVAGLRIDLREGTVTSCSSRLNGEQAGAWASGSDAAWLRALAEAEPGELELSGDRPLARLVAGGLHRALFDPPRSHLAPGDRRAE